jgi:hypothetical protein
MPNKLIDIENEFEDIQDFFDEKAIATRTAVKNRDYKTWYAANSERLNDLEYVKKLSESISTFYKDNPNFQKEKVNSKKWKEAHKEGVKNYINGPDYVHPKGMLGKIRSEESKKKASEKLKGQVKPLEGNKKISEQRLGKKPKHESIEKMRQKLLGRETGRSRQVQTPSGVFNKLKDAADHYGVSTGSIKNFIAGQNVKEWFKPHLESKGVMFNDLKPLGFSWLGDVQKELGAKKVQTPDGIFDNVVLASIFYKITPTAIRFRIKAQPNKYFYIQ